jgi:hypothetical protein
VPLNNADGLCGVNLYSKQKERIMKKIFAIALLLGAVSLTANAQRSTSNYPQWALSKEVQKQQFRNVLYRPATVTTAGAIVTSKGIANLQANREMRSTSKVAMNGTPSFVISKGVARKQYESKR